MSEIESINESLREERTSTFLQATITIVAPSVAGLAMAIWSALSGDGGRLTILYSLGAAVLVLAVTWLLQRVHVSDVWRRRARSAAVMLVLAATIAAMNWMVGLAQELRAFRTDPKRTAERIVERIDPNSELLARNAELQGKVTKLEADLQDSKRSLSAAQAEIARLAALLRSNRDTDAALKALASLRVEWNAYLTKAAGVCRKDQIGTMDQAFSALSRKTRETIVAVGYPDYVPDFTDSTRCGSAGISNNCLAGGGFNPEATAFFSSAQCRISNLAGIIDKIRSQRSRP